MKKTLTIILCLAALAVRAQYTASSFGLSNTVPLSATNTYAVASSNVLDLTRYNQFAVYLTGSGANTNTNAITFTFQRSLDNTNWFSFFSWQSTPLGTNAHSDYYETTNVGVFGYVRLRTVGSSLTNDFTNAVLKGYVKGFRRD